MKELGVGIIGTGWVSGEYIRAFEANPHTEVLGLVSRNRDARQSQGGSVPCGALPRL